MLTVRLAIEVLSPGATARIYAAAILIFIATAVAALINDKHHNAPFGLSLGLAVLALPPAWNAWALS